MRLFSNIMRITHAFSLIILLFGVFAIMTATTGCATNKMNRIKIPGNPILNDYGIRFKIDWDAFESGTYIYNPDNVIKGIPNLIGGGVFGHLDFYTLILDFKFKDGREYHEKIDLKPLIRKMVQKYTIPDLSKTKWGGFATIIIRVERDRIKMDYELSEMIKKGNPIRHLSKKYFFPIFEKNLN